MNTPGYIVDGSPERMSPWLIGISALCITSAVALFTYVDLWFVPLLVASGIGIVMFSIRYPEVWLHAVSLSLPLFFSTSDVGVSSTDVALGAFLIGSLVIWLVHHVLVARRTLVRNGFDGLLMVYMSFMTLNVFVALANGTELMEWVRSYGIGFLILYYFPFREYCGDERVLRRVVTVLSLCVVGLTMKSILDYRSIVKASEYAFQIAGRRVIPHVFLMSSIGAFVWAVTSKFHWRRTSAYVYALLFAGGLVTTYARTTWIAFIFCVVIVQKFFDSSERRRTLTLLVSMIAVTYISINVVFGSTATLVVKVIANRFTSSSNVKKDAAIGNRVYESRTVAKLIAQNPVSGYGLAAVYKGYDGITGESTPKTYIHNGLLAPMFSFGPVGALLQYCLLIASIIRSFSVARAVRSPLARIVAMTCFLTMVGMFLENITAAMFFFRSAVFVLALGFAGISVAETLEAKAREAKTREAKTFEDESLEKKEGEAETP